MNDASANPSGQVLLQLAHQVLQESRRLMLPHHFQLVGARQVYFDAIQLNSRHVTGISQGRFKTHIIFTGPGLPAPSLTRQQMLEDTVIIDLTHQPADLEALRHFLLDTEEQRKWHHAPWIALNQIRRNHL